ncbi:MAG: MarR family winged helix-turn-helix transcriptional regulator [Pikeienuella sp.]
MLRRKHEALLEDIRRRGGPDGGMIKLCFELLSLADAIDGDCAARLRPHRLSESKFTLLTLLRDRPEGLAPHELASRAGVTRATITGLIDGLERDGLLARAPEPADRRMIRVALTAAGADLAARLTESHGRWIASLAADLSAEERRLLSLLLRKIWARTDAGRAAGAAA